MCVILSALAMVSWALLPIPLLRDQGGARAGDIVIRAAAERGVAARGRGAGPFAAAADTTAAQDGASDRRRVTTPDMPAPAAALSGSSPLSAPRGAAPPPVRDPQNAFVAAQQPSAPVRLSMIERSSPHLPVWSANPRPARRAEDAGPDLFSLDPAQGWHAVKIRRGDTLTGIFRREGLSQAEALRVSRLDGTGMLARIRPGQVLHLLPAGDAPGRVDALAFEPEPLTRLEVRRDSDTYRVRTRHFTPRLEHRYASNEIRTSLFQAGNEAGLSEQMMHELVQIFGWSLDFALDIRRGDRFSVMYEQRYHDGELVAEGPIVAAEFVNQGRKLVAVSYTDDEGHRDYYTPEGLSMRRQFLRTPVKVGRITSGFTKRRFHPILKRWRSHKGVDYGAPHGTAVLATADGRVAERGRKGGYGNAVVLRHGSRYRTLYGHLSRFAKGITPGANVRQGEVIGYVGATGLATGPHLHYEFQVNGAHRDPVTFDMPPAEPIADALRVDFLQHAQTWTAKLDSERTRAIVQQSDEHGPAARVATSN